MRSARRAAVGARPVFVRVEGAPFQPGERVRVARAIDPEVSDVSVCVGGEGTVAYLEYSCGCGQTYPHDPMIGVRLDAGRVEEFWRDELESVEPAVI